jgi:hypothetical protein
LHTLTLKRRENHEEFFDFFLDGEELMAFIHLDNDGAPILNRYNDKKSEYVKEDIPLGITTLKAK